MGMTRANVSSTTNVPSKVVNLSYLGGGGGGGGGIPSRKLWVILYILIPFSSVTRAYGWYFTIAFELQKYKQYKSYNCAKVLTRSVETDRIRVNLILSAHHVIRIQ